MSDAIDDFEALFEEIAAQRVQSVAGQSQSSVGPPAAVSEPAPAAVTAAAPLSAEGEGNKQIYERLGGIVRMLHDSLRELGYDRSLSDVATQITDAQERLTYIATLTEQAAVKVLNAVDGCMPAQDVLAREARDMDNRWNLLFEGKLGIEEFKALAGDSKRFAARVAEATDAEKARLLEIMMAQDFQDITGQLIKKIVTITSTAERELAQLLRDHAPAPVKTAMSAEQAKPAELMQGPATPGAAMAQDDVDSLLAELGF